MYREAVEQGIVRRLLGDLGWTESKTIKLFEDQAKPTGNHDIRAALISLMTAGFAASSGATVVGDAAHGWFWLPPWGRWEPWAKDALTSQIQKLAGGGDSAICRWPGPILR